MQEFWSEAVARVNFMHPEAVARLILVHFSHLSGISRDTVEQETIYRSHLQLQKGSSYVVARVYSHHAVRLCVRLSF